MSAISAISAISALFPASPMSPVLLISFKPAKYLIARSMFRFMFLWLAVLLSALLLAGISTSADAVAVAAVSAAAVCKAPRQVESGAATVSVAELYTSEGCDSCPPADKWFSTLSFAQNGVVPLAFHVDYWDYIGWKDRFAQPGFTVRQRALVTQQGSRTVYTPQVMLGGADARATSFSSQFGASVKKINALSAPVKLKLNAESRQNAIDVTVAVDGQSRNADLYIAVTENNLVSRVSAGENKGAVLKHDHVVRELIGPMALPPDTERSAAAGIFKQTIKVASDWKIADVEVAAFVQARPAGTVLQALSTPVCAP